MNKTFLNSVVAASLAGSLGLLSTSAAMAQGSESCTFSVYQSGTCVAGQTSFELGDKLFELNAFDFGDETGSINFSWTPDGVGGFEGDLFDVVVDFIPDATNDIIQAPLVKTGFIDYNLSILPQFQEEYSFFTVEIDSDTSGNLTSVVKILGDDVVVLTSVNGSNSLTPVVIPGDLDTIGVVDTYSITGLPVATLKDFTNSFTQQRQDVPGPLPLFGAAAAFGYSRKLRNRIKSAV